MEVFAAILLVTMVLAFVGRVAFVIATVTVRFVLGIGAGFATGFVAGLATGRHGSNAPPSAPDDGFNRRIEP